MKNYYSEKHTALQHFLKDDDITKKYLAVGLVVWCFESRSIMLRGPFSH